jgi:hypothetical protein
MATEHNNINANNKFSVFHGGDYLNDGRLLGFYTMQ